MNGVICAEAQAAGAGSFLMLAIYVIVFGGAIYFLMVRPQKKEQKRLDALLASMTPGDSVLTTSGFYGVVIDVTDDTVIVEFGNNKNCRIPMQKTAITQVEKPEDAVEQ